MPQIAQLSVVYASQWFWLLITLGTIYFLVGKGMVPKIERTMDDRNAQIARDLAAADAARTEADRVEEAYRLRMDEGRAEAVKLTAKAKAAGATASEQTLAASDAAIQERIGAAQARIRTARGAALKEIEGMAAELTKDIAAMVAKVDVSLADSAAAVKTVMANA